MTALFSNEKEIGSYRRYCLLSRMIADRTDRPAEASVWHAKQEAEPGTLLPSGFPLKTELAAVGYVAKEDLDFADVDELVSYVSLSASDAQTVLAAHAAL